MALDGAAPPLEHRLTGFGALRDRAIDAALEERRRRAVVVLEEQRLAEGHQEVDVIAGIEIGDAHRAERDARRGQVVGVGALAVALEMRARQHHGGRIGGRGLLLRERSPPRSRRRTAVRCRACAPGRDRRAAQPQSLPEPVQGPRRKRQRREVTTHRFYSRMVLPSPQMLKLAATLALVSTLAAAQAAGTLRVRVVLTDVSGVATPVPRLVLLVSDDPPTAEPRRVRTDRRRHGRTEGRAGHLHRRTRRADCIPRQGLHLDADRRGARRAGHGARPHRRQRRERRAARASAPIPQRSSPPGATALSRSGRRPAMPRAS